MLSRRIETLLHDLEAFGQQFGYLVKLESGERTCEDQRRIYRNLRKPFVPCSYHLDGNAIDVSLSGAGFPDKDTVLRAMGVFAKQRGFRWGGDGFGDFGLDPSHFDDGLRVGSPACCRGGSDGPVLVNQKRMVKTRRHRGGAEEVCVYCGRSGRVKKITRSARRNRPSQVEQDCDDE